jgi:hypothetical protein
MLTTLVEIHGGEARPLCESQPFSLPIALAIDEHYK